MSEPNRPQKRKMGNYYAVARGRSVGIYDNWSQCFAEVNGYRGARFKKFKTMEEANQFIDDHPSHTSTNNSANVIASTQTLINSLLPQTSSKTLTAKTENNLNTAEAYIDGSCLRNGFKGAKAGIGVHWKDSRLPDVSQPISGLQTNNRAEIGAAVHAILQAKRNGYKSVILHTDSNLLYNSQTQWKKYWMRNNWRKADGTEVKNKDDYLALEDASVGMNVEYRKVLAHSGIDGNERADKLAKAAIE